MTNNLQFIIIESTNSIKFFLEELIYRLFVTKNFDNDIVNQLIKIDNDVGFISMDILGDIEIKKLQRYYELLKEYTNVLNKISKEI